MNDSVDGLEGGCLCGGIRYRITGTSAFVGQCCCRDCQKATGTGHTTIIAINKNQLSLTGQPKTYSNRGDSGGDVTRHFCGVCGGRLYTSGTLPGDMIMIQAGSLDDPSRLKPQSVLYYKRAMPWDWFDPGLAKFDALPPRGS